MITASRPRARFGSGRKLGLIERILTLSETEAEFKTRNFSSNNDVKRLLLERVGKTFISGYNHALSGGTISTKTEKPNLQGFFFEGIAMGVAVNEAVPIGIPKQISLSDLVEIQREKNPYLTAVGAGWAMARLQWRRNKIIDQLDNFLVSLAFDGWGFHDCYFNPARIVSGPTQAISRVGGRQALHSWYQGAGRALWFVSGANPKFVHDKGNLVPEMYRSDLYSGVGLAMTYAGGLRPESARLFSEHSGQYRSYISQGAAFGIEAHLRAGTQSSQNLDIVNALTSQRPEYISHMVRELQKDHKRQSSHSVEDGMQQYSSWRNSVVSFFDDRGYEND